MADSAPAVVSDLRAGSRPAIYRRIRAYGAGWRALKAQVLINAYPLLSGVRLTILSGYD
jgi:hypothetical protein